MCDKRFDFASSRVVRVDILHCFVGIVACVICYSFLSFFVSRFVDTCSKKKYLNALDAWGITHLYLHNTSCLVILMEFVSLISTLPAFARVNCWVKTGHWMIRGFMFS
uniref:Uncharacterized protein n=1 Tax=Arundo donax TaxID=35708 RepID=A0A0A9G500_ARUDO